MIPMRDGVRLETVLLAPRNAEARAANYVKATQRVYRGSAVVLPVVK